MSGYGDAWQLYWSKGWKGVLPLPHQQKTPPPGSKKGTSYTGYEGEYPSFADCYAWAEENPDGNICLRVPNTVVGIDVDAYDGKTGAETLAHAEALWGPLPPTVRSTSRNDPISGIRMYRIPAGVEFDGVLRFKEQNLGHIEIIQYFHRYTVVWPSEHNEPPHRKYRWLDHDGFTVDDIPAIDDLPDLPQTWIDGLQRAAAATAVTTHVDATEMIGRLPQGDADDEVKAALLQAAEDIHGKAGSRHDTTLMNVGRLLRLAEQGHPGVPAALTALEKVWVQVLTPDRGADKATAEFASMVMSPRIHDLIASSPTVHIASFDNVEKLEAPAVEQDEFWDARPSLKIIRQFAYARMCSPWAVLGAVMCRALTTVPPHITLPALVGGKGSLNLFVALVGVPGDGKDAAHDAACDVYPGPEGYNAIYTAPAGSAEGIAHQYKHREKSELIQDRNAVMFWMPEIDTLIAVGNRAGSAIMPTLRSAFTGADIGFSWADATKRLPMAKHTYRLTMLLGVQPEHAEPLMADASGGFPQRCIWLPSIDKGISRKNRPTEPDPLPFIEGREWAGGIYDRTIQLPDEVVDIILEAREQRGQGIGHALDGHALFTQEKVATALAVIDMRSRVDMSDWELAGYVMAVSNATRQKVEDAIAQKHVQENKAQGVAEAHRKAESDEVLDTEKVKRIGKRIVGALERKGPLAKCDLKKASTSGADRLYFDRALETQAAAGNVQFVDGKWCTSH